MCMHRGLSSQYTRGKHNQSISSRALHTVQSSGSIAPAIYLYDEQKGKFIVVRQHNDKCLLFVDFAVRTCRLHHVL